MHFRSWKSTAAYGEYCSWNHKITKRMASERPDMQFQSQLTLEFLQWQLSLPFICSFTDSFMHSTNISPERNMVLNCGIEEGTRHSLRQEAFGEREWSWFSAGQGEHRVLGSRWWRWRGQGQFPRTWRIRGASLVKRREKGSPGAVTKYAEPQENR